WRLPVGRRNSTSDAGFGKATSTIGRTGHSRICQTELGCEVPSESDTREISGCVAIPRSSRRPETTPFRTPTVSSPRQRRCSQGDTSPRRNRFQFESRALRCWYRPKACSTERRRRDSSGAFAPRSQKTPCKHGKTYLLVSLLAGL